MSADLLRRAATLMRERAQTATPGPWHSEHPDSYGPGGAVFTLGEDVLGGTIATPLAEDCYPRGGYNPWGDMQHIASWHPAVALAVADWLDAQAGFADVLEDYLGLEPGGHSLAVARAYLGEQA